MKKLLKKQLSNLILLCLIFQLSILATTPPEKESILDSQEQNQSQKIYKKDWNFMVYIASNNNLYQNSIKNIQQMMQIGSNLNINILVQQDTYGKNEISRYYIEKGNLHLMYTQNNCLESISGTPQNLYKFAEWAISNYPANHQALILWNHGSGIEDPAIWGRVCKQYPNEIFSINSQTGLMELTRKSQKERGIAFNDVFKTYITNQELKNTLQKIKTNLLGRRKIDIIGMDACNMAMLEVGTQIKDATRYMVGSEEVEPATGWNYSFVLKPFEKHSLKPKEFVKHIVQAYKQEYQYSYADHTQSAISLKNHNELELNINGVAIFLTSMLEGIDKKEILSILKKVRNSNTLSTIFDNRNYIDMNHFYKSLLNKIEKKSTNIFKFNLLEKLLISGLELIKTTVLANTCGRNLPNAAGISFYFPRKKVHSSYQETIFAQKNKWANFLDKYLQETKEISLKN